MMDSGLLSLKWNNHGSTFFHVLSNIKRKGTYTDVTLTCEGKFYQVHKLVLSTCSEYFEEIFKRTQSKDAVIVLMDMKHEELEALLNYMYIGEVNVLSAELPGLVKAAERLKIKGLAVPDEEPLSKSDSNKENKRSSQDNSYNNSSSSSGGSLHKRPRQDQALEGSKERRGSSEANRTNDTHVKKRDSTSNTSQPIEVDEDTPTIKKEIEEPKEKDARTSESSLVDKSNLVFIDETPTFKKEIEEPKEEEQEVLISDSSLEYDSMAPGMTSVGDSQHISARPQSIEDLVAQSIPGPSSIQEDWAGGRRGGGNSENLYHEGFHLDDSSQGIAHGGQEMVSVPFGFLSGNTNTEDSKSHQFLDQWLSSLDGKSKSHTSLSLARYDEILFKLKSARDNMFPKTQEYYGYQRRFDIATIGDMDKLIKKRKTEYDPILYYVPNEELFPTIQEVHLSLGHSGINKTTDHLKKKYANVTQSSIILYISLCDECAHRHNNLSSRSLGFNPF